MGSGLGHLGWGWLLIRYFIDGKPFDLRVDNAAEATFGAAAILSTPTTDITASQPWYDTGYTVADLFPDAEFRRFRSGIEASVGAALAALGRDITGFTLETYHHFVDDAAHAAVVTASRAFLQRDLNIDLDALHDRLGRIVGQDLTDDLSEIVAGQSGRMSVVVRINRPGSGDFNPVHKDIYEAVDHRGQVPRLVNFWIPLAGVGSQSSLPIVPGSHLLDESAILRTRAGSVVEGRHYRVNSILEWAGERSLQRARIQEGQVLIFSSHLIHGLAVNDQPDTTRVALELRLGAGR